MKGRTTEQGTVLTTCNFSLDARLKQIQRSLYVNYGDVSLPPMEGPSDDNENMKFENTYVRHHFTPLTPSSMYGMKP